ncbi:Serine/threonine-protein kinase PrkC [Rubripirellula lacrimiformis]|uniref:Serine/threonine-protein kinase PrkC n=1 Tax=Rubripirellula lacrimiformis TaxID=1930273 RepID=A0A517N760_9BACT|nr:serine/threonine-protein kinase [Rubripirellula lacrimiformis]QDT02989.1 Serine/threonine-protein kinase PrkC [Rubripirellula lacrimiformis]
MIAMKTQCLTDEQLKRFLGGNMNDQAFGVVHDHVDGCESCQSRASDLDAGSVGDLGAWDDVGADESPGNSSPMGPIDPIEAESACQFAVHRLLDRRTIQDLSGVDPSGTNLSGTKLASSAIDQLGPYRILGEIGRGGMGTVCLAQHQRLKRRCAIKLLPPTRVAQPGWLDRFEREMAAVASLEHPGIVRASDAGTESGWHYLVMEYLDGLDLARVASRVGPLSIADACEVVRQASMALSHVHGNGLVHRDVKPSNLMLTRSGVVKLLDLGLVLAGDDPLSFDDRLTTVGHLMGTLPAMSPEQLMDSRGVDAAADVYSLGATLYRLIVDRWPFPSGGGIAARVLAITTQSPVPLAKVRSEVDSDLSNLVARMLDRDPAKRPSADRVAQQLQQWTGDANLKKLIRRAEAAPDAFSETGPAMLSAAAVDAPPPGRGRRRLIAGGFRSLGWLAAGVIAATVVIQIRAERGDIVVTTDGQDTQIAVLPDNGVDSAARNADPVSPMESPVQTEDTDSEAAVDPLYLGQDFDHWISVLKREQQIEAIGEAMRAIELLSREQPARRKEAARQTMLLTNQYGSVSYDHNPGWNSGIGNRDLDSSRFMGYLLQVAPKYGPEPLLGTLQEMLKVGNRHAKIAVVMTLQHYVDGWGSWTGSPESRNASRQYFAAMGQSAEGKEELTQLLAGLGEIARWSTAAQPVDRKGDGEAEFMTVSQSENTYLRQKAWGIARTLVVAADGTIDQPAWMIDYVQDQIDRAVTAYQNRSAESDLQAGARSAISPGGMTGTGMMGGFPQPVWVIDGDLLLAALEMQRDGLVTIPTDYAVAVMTAPFFAYFSDPADPQIAVDTLIQADANAKQLIAESIDQQLMLCEVIYDQNQDVQPFASLVGHSMFQLTGPIFAANVTATAPLVERISKLILATQNANDQAANLTTITQTLATLRQRIEEK